MVYPTQVIPQEASDKTGPRLGGNCLLRECQGAPGVGCVNEGVLGMLPKTQCPAHARDPPLRPPPRLIQLPGGACGGVRWPGHSDRNPDAECCTVTHGQEVASEGPMGGWGSQARLLRGQISGAAFPPFPVAIRPLASQLQQGRS